MSLNILHIIQRYPPAPGGSEAYFARLSRWLVQRGHRVTVWTTDADDLTAFWEADGRRLPGGDSEVDGVTVRRFPIDHWPLRRYLLKGLSLLPVPALRGWTLPVNPISGALRREADRTAEKFDAVHASAFPYLYPCLCGLRLARRLKVPFALTPFVHIGPWNEPDNPIRRAYLAKPMVRLLKQADLVFAQTPSERRAIVEAGVPGQRVVLQGLGVDPAEVMGGNRKRARAGWGLTDRHLAIGHLANQSREKGTFDLLRAVRRLVEKKRRAVELKRLSEGFDKMKRDAWELQDRLDVPNEELGEVLARADALEIPEGDLQGTRIDPEMIRVVLAGPQMPQFRQFKFSDEYREFMVQLGALTDPQRRDFYAGIDLFCLPSVSDSFGLVLLEAMANGKPCLGYRAGGVGDVLNGPGGYLADYDTRVESGLVPALESLLADDEWRDAGIDAALRVKREFPWEPKLELVEKEIEKLIR